MTKFVVSNCKCCTE